MAILNKGKLTDQVLSLTQTDAFSPLQVDKGIRELHKDNMLLVTNMVESSGHYETVQYLCAN